MRWTPDPACFGYRFYINDHPVSKSTKPGQTTTTFKTDGQPTAYGIAAAYEHAPETVVYPTPPPPPVVSLLPKQGISVGANAIHQTQATLEWELDLCQEAGAQFARLDLYEGDTTRFSSYDSRVRARGMETMAILHGTARTPFGATQAEAFARKSGTAFPQIRLFEFCNEPDLNGWTPEQYTAAAHGFCKGLRAVRPDATLLVGALWKWKDTPTEASDGWVKRMIAAGFPDTDLLSLHLYDSPDWNDPRNIWNQAFGPLPAPRVPIRQQLDNAGLAHIRLCSTENGGPTPKYTEAQQAAYVDGDFDAVADGRLAFHTVFTMLDKPQDNAPGFCLVEAGGRRKPAYNTYKTRASQ